MSELLAQFVERRLRAYVEWNVTGSSPILPNNFNLIFC